MERVTRIPEYIATRMGCSTRIDCFRPCNSIPVLVCIPVRASFPAQMCRSHLPFHACLYPSTGSYPNTRIHVITRIPECNILPEHPDTCYCPTTRTDFHTRVETPIAQGLDPSMELHPTTRIPSNIRLPEYTLPPEYRPTNTDRQPYI